MSVVILGLGEALLGKDRGDGRGEGGLAVVNVADRADVHVRFVAFELSLSHYVGWFWWSVGFVELKIFRLGALRPGLNR